MLTTEQVKEKAPARVNMVSNYAYRRLFYLKDGIFHPVYMEIGDKERMTLLTTAELDRIQSEEALKKFTKFVNSLDDISGDDVFLDDEGKSIYDYAYAKSIYPEFEERKVLKLRE